jgi:hypothetical protein
MNVNKYKFAKLLNEARMYTSVKTPKDKNNFIQELLGKQLQFNIGSAMRTVLDANKVNIIKGVQDMLRHYLFNQDYYNNVLDSKISKEEYSKRVWDFIYKLTKGNWKSFLKYFTLEKTSDDYLKSFQLASKTTYIKIPYPTGDKLYKDFGKKLEE